MNLPTLLKQSVKTLTPQAAIVIKRPDETTVQTVVYHPQLLNLGVILVGYYVTPAKVDQLSRLGNCLSVGHYVQAPRTLQYGRDFANESQFKALPAKLRKHLTGEVQDCTISLLRDYGLDDQSSRKVTGPSPLGDQFPSLKYVYVYQDRRWDVFRLNGRNLDHPVSLRKRIRTALK